MLLKLLVSHFILTPEHVKNEEFKGKITICAYKNSFIESLREWNLALTPLHYTQITTDGLLALYDRIEVALMPPFNPDKEFPGNADFGKGFECLVDLKLNIDKFSPIPRNRLAASPVNSSDPSTSFASYKFLKNGFQEEFPIHLKDFEKLTNTKFLNDTIIMFYLTFWHNELVNKTIKNDIYFTNTYFMTFLIEGNNLKAHSQLRNINIFDKQYFIIPIHSKEKAHWSFMLVVGLREWAKEINEMTIVEPDLFMRSWSLLSIYYFDSLNIASRHYRESIISFLSKELETKYFRVHNKLLFPYGHSFPEIIMTQLILPKQPNSFDCGIFLLENIESFFENHKENLIKAKETNGDLRDLFPLVLADSKREQIQFIISSLKDKIPNSAIVEAYSMRRKKLIIMNFGKDKLQKLENLPNIPDDTLFRIAQAKEYFKK